MNLAWAAAGAVIGWPAGAGLRGTVFRLSVPSGAPARTRCPCCAAPVGRWRAARCRRCGVRLGPPLAMELGTATVLALLAGRFGARPETLAYALLGVVGVALSAIDVAVQRLPDRLVLPAYPVLLAALAAPALLARDPAALVRAALAGLALAAAYLVLALVRPGQLGAGDVKLAGLAGLAMGWLGWRTLADGTALAFALAAVVSLALLALRRITLRGQIAFGPFLLGGALIAVLLAGP